MDHHDGNVYSNLHWLPRPWTPRPTFKLEPTPARPAQVPARTREAPPVRVRSRSRQTSLIDEVDEWLATATARALMTPSPAKK
jgi:hypothetical protein